jgi:hypothetical protein
MTPTLPLQIACPRCASPAVAYSCEPRCCFNHVCAACRCTFQTATEATGGKLQGLAPPDPLPDSSDPTAPCGECRSTAVFRLADDRIVCTRCGALLELQLEDIA